MLSLNHFFTNVSSSVACVFVQYAWVEKHFGEDFLEQVILTRDKTLVTGDILIDDRPDVTGEDGKL